MSKQVDERVVTMQFDNRQFEDNVKTSMSTIDKLKKALNFEKAGEGLEKVKDSINLNKINITGLSGAIDQVNAKFSALQVIGVTALSNITNQAMSMSKKMISALTINPVKDGLKEYETQMNAVQTILANTQKEGTNVKIVNKALDELNAYADKTIYNFTEMTRNIGTFTAAGVKLDTSVSAIKGIANLAAISGSTSQQASTAMYQLSQALASGTVKLMDWNSVVNAGMGGQVFQDALTRTSEHLQTGAKAAIEAKGSFRESLQTGWLTTEVLTQTLDQFSTAADTQAEYEAAVKKFVSQGYSKEEAKQLADMAKTAGEAATKVKTFTQLIDTLKEALGSGWTTTWRLIIGDFEEARNMWTNVSDVLGGFINKMSDARNAVLESAMGKGLSGIADKINSIVEPFQKAASTVTKTVDAVSDLGDVVDDVILGKFGNGTERVTALTEAGLNYYRVQNRVNEVLNNSFRFTEKQIEEQDKLLGINAKSTDVTKEETKETDKLADSKKELIKQFANMSDAQLRSIGLSPSEIASFRELRNMADMLGMSLDDVIDNMDHLNGRWLLMQSFSNIGHNIITIFKSIGEAWKEVFPPVTADNLFSLLAGFYKLTTSMKITDEEADKLKRAFKGLFAVLDLVSTLVGGGLRLALKVTSYILSLFNLSLLDVAAILGDVLVKFRDWVKGNNLITKAFKTMAPYLKEFVLLIVDGIIAIKDWVVANEKITQGFKNILSYLKEAGAGFKAWIEGAREAENIPVYIIQGLVNGLKNGISTVASIVIELAKSIIETICGVLGIHSPSVVFFAIGSFIVLGLVAGIQSELPGVWETVKSLATGLVEIISNINFGAIFAGMMGLGTILLLKKIADAFEIISGPIEGVSHILNGFGSILDSVAKNIKASAFKKKSVAIRNFAISLGILAASLLVISKIPVQDLIKAGVAITVMAGVLIGLSYAISVLNVVTKGGLDTSGRKIAVMLVGVGVALYMMAKVARAVGELKWEQIAKGLVFMGVLELFVVTLIAVSESAGEHADKAGKMIYKIAGALLIMTLVAKIAGNLKPQEMKNGLKFIAVVGTFVIALVGISLLAGEHADSAAKMIQKFANALLILAITAKIVGNLSPEEWLKAIGFIGMISLFIVGLIAVSEFAGEHANEAGKMLERISFALLVMAATTKIVGSMKADELGKGLIFIGVLSLFIAGIVAVSKYAGENIAKAGAMLLGVAAAIGVMGLVIKMVGTMETKDLLKGIAVVAVLESFIIGMIAVSKLAGENAVKAGSMVLKISASLLIMTAALFLIGQMDTKKLWKAVGVIAILEALFAGLIAVSKLAGDCNKTIITITICVATLAAMMGVLTMLDQEKLLKSAESLSMVMVAMAAMIAATGQIKNTEGATKVLLQISLVVLMLVGVLGMIQALNIEGNMGAVASISVLLVSMAASLALLGNTKDISLKAVGAMALMGLVVAELAVVMKAMDKLNIDVSTKTVAQLSALLLAMSGALVILTVVGIGGAAAFVGIGALVTLIAAVGGLMIAIGALNDEFPAVADFVHNSIPILQDMGEGLGNFIGGLVGGVVAGAIDSLAGIGTSLSTFMENLQPFIEKVSAIDPDAMAGGEALAKMLLTLTAAELVSGLSKFLGVKDLGNLGSQLSAFGDAIIAFSDKLNNGDCINDKAVQKAAKAGEMMAKLQSSLYGTGGLKQDIFGEKDLGDFGSQMSKFADGIIAFATKVEAADINQDSVDAAAYAGETMATLQSKIKSQNGALQDIFGSQDLGDFGSQMSNFADGVVNFDKKLKANDGISSDLADQAAYAGNVMAELQNNTGAIGGVVKYFAGEKNLGTFGTQIALYGSALAAFSQVLSENPVDTTTVSIAKDCGLLMTELQTALPETHLFDGKMDLDDFGAKLMSFGKYMGVFATMTAEMDVSNLTTVSMAAKRLGEMTQSISTVDQTKIDEFDFEGIGNSIKTFCDSFDNVDASKVETAISSINKLVNTIKSMDGLNTNGVNTFKGILNSLSGDTVNLKGIGNSFSDDQIASFNSIGSSVVSAIASGMKSKSSEFTSIGHSILSSIKSSLNYNIQQFKTSGETIMSNFVSGIKGSRNTASSAFTSMMAFITLSLKGYYNNFYTIGGYLVTGFANGISASAYKAKAKAKDMAKDAEKAAREELQVHSPSKKLDKVGQYFGMGFANGIDKKSHLSVQAAKTMAASAIDSTKQTISRLGQMLAMDVDAQPTIRPVMDLSDINSGVATMNGMLAMNPSVGVMTNIGAINASMRNRQNGNANDVISAINTLGKTLGNTRGDTYIIDGITYDDGSGINDAVQTLIRAARIERRM